MSATTSHDHRTLLEHAATSLFTAVGTRDLAGVAACFSADARLRAILPGGVEEHTGPDAIAGAYARWFGTAETFELVESSVSVVVDRFWVRYRARVEFPDDAADVYLIEQHAVGDASPVGIDALDLVCSGFRRLPVRGSNVELFDAGRMGCADGLAPEFRRRIQAIPAGAVLRVIVRDPAAKEDLPPLARMMGHRIQSVDTLEDGRVQIDVERV